MSGLLVVAAGVCIFAAFTAINLHLGRSWLYPGTVFAGAWTVVFLLLCIAQAWLYPLPWDALGLFAVGAAYFTLGGWMGLKSVRGPWLPASLRSIPRRAQRNDHRLLLMTMVLLAAGLPLYIQDIARFSSAPMFTPAFFLQVRQGMIEQSASVARAPIVENLVVLSSIFALIAMAVSEGARRWKGLVTALVVLAIVYNLLTAAKAGVVGLAVALVLIYGLKRGGLSKTSMVWGALLFLGGFGAITVLRFVAQAGGALSISEAIRGAAQELLNYFTVSVVAFGQYLREPGRIPAVWTIWLFFERTANYFGSFFMIPNQNAAYIDVGPGLSYNTYTAYFAYYPNYGVGGVAVIMLLLGWVGAVVYNKARHGRTPWVTLYGVLCYGYAATVFNESLITGLNYIFKLIAVSVLFAAARRLRLARKPKELERHHAPII